MTVLKLAISLERELAMQIKRSAAGETVSSWLADAARRKLDNEGLIKVVKDWERENGSPTASQMTAVKKEILTAQREFSRRTKKARR